MKIAIRTTSGPCVPPLDGEEGSRLVRLDGSTPAKSRLNERGPVMLRFLLGPMIASALVTAALPALAQNEPLYPRLECYQELPADLKLPEDPPNLKFPVRRVRMHFGVTNLLTVAVTPSLNIFTVGDIERPTPRTYEPGYTPRAFSTAVTPAPGLIVSWALGQGDFVLGIDTGNLTPDQRCSSVAPGILPSAQVYTFPASGMLTIEDPNVTPRSVILLQYVGDLRPRSPRKLSVTDLQDGQFTATGHRGRQFRYVVFN